MLPLLCVTLFRLKNFAGLRLDRHLMRHGDVVKLEIAPEEVKNGKRLERVIPPEVVALLDRYLEHHRPRLLQGRRSPVLWITEYGTDASPGVVADRICEQTKRFLGVRISPHRFRHCAATSIATARPELATLIRPLLGHGSGGTADRYYNRAQMVSASRRYSTEMERIMQEARACDVHSLEAET
jgi:integrase/recombinase XerD